MAKSCSTCDGCVLADQTRAVFKRDVGADVCATTGNILSRPGLDDSANERIKHSIAETCPSYGQPRPTGRPANLVCHVAIGDPKAITASATRGAPSGLDKPPTCNGCVNFIPHTVVKKELGWSLAMCAVKGRLLFNNDLFREASVCEQGFTGEPRDTADGVMLLPQYDGGTTPVGVKPRPAGAGHAAGMARHFAVDPRDFETDVPVTDGERDKFFVKAWRLIEDPEGIKPAVKVPVFYGEKLCGFDPRDTYGNYRPDLYIDHQGLIYDLAVLLLDIEFSPVMIGQAGTGKTEAACVLAWLMDLPFYPIAVDKGTEIHHLAGDPGLVIDPASGKQITTFVKGSLTRVYDQPGVIIVDEPNLRNDVYEFLRPALGVRELEIKETGERLTQGFHTFLMCSQNPAHDPIYVGTEPMNVADMDRAVPIEVGLPPEAIERDIILAHCKKRDGYDLDPRVLDQIMQIAKDIRQSIEDGNLPIAWGIRTQIKVARLTRVFSIQKAYRRAIVDFLDQNQADLIMSFVSTVVDGS